jgi:hypothetical protein
MYVGPYRIVTTTHAARVPALALTRRAPDHENARSMSLRRALILLVVAGLCGLVLSLVRQAGGPRWRTLRDGMEFTTLRGDPLCRRGSSEIAVLRLDPARVRLSVRHYSREEGGVPLTIVEWQQRTGALAVFNAGQYYPDLSYMGLLVSDGVRVSKRLHPEFKAALVASPADGRMAARVLDLDHDPVDPEAPGWREVAQSFMLFDRNRRPRIRKSDAVSNRTAVAQDGKGRIVVITTEGGYTLWDFAQLLLQAPIGLSHAMSMDGGYEAELCVSTPPFHYASFGQWKGPGDVADEPGAKVPLPAVITVVPR